MSKTSSAFVVLGSERGACRTFGWCAHLLRLITLFAFVYLIASRYLDVAFPFQRNTGGSAFKLQHQKPLSYSWVEDKPSIDLRYTACFNGFQCARLDVPLNWNATDLHRGPRAAVAIVKLPAKVPVTDPRYGGAVLMNPGGPGESGIHQVLDGGRDYQAILDSSSPPSASDESAKYFDIIGFDPRGVNNTTPRLRCFPDTFNQQVWSFKSPDYGQLWDSPTVLGVEWSRAVALGGSCSRQEDTEDMIRFVNTAQTVQDMVAIIEAHGRWREKEVSRILDHQGRRSSIMSRSDVWDRTKHLKAKEKLLYWGFSYGTLLGSTFAAMHPDRIARIVLDGVVDPVDHYAGEWLTQLQDSDKIIFQLCQDCYAVGAENCPLYTGSSGVDIETRLQRVMEKLRFNPVPVPSVGIRGPELVMYGDIYLMMLSSMYFPYAWGGAENFFRLLAHIETGNGTEIANVKQAMLQPASLSPDCQRDGPFSDACTTTVEGYISGLGPSQAISCMDAGGQTAMTKDGFVDYLQALGNQSRWISGSWARNKIACVGYTVSPAWRFEGPIQGNLSHPMLLIGNTHDTVTPLRNAQRVSKLFPGSVVLQQNSEGHCSYSNPSLCTGKVIRAYFQTGKLPEPGTICQPESKPFVGCLRRNSDGECERLQGDDLILWEAMMARARL